MRLCWINGRFCTISRLCSITVRQERRSRALYVSNRRQARACRLLIRMVLPFRHDSGQITGFDLCPRIAKLKKRKLYLPKGFTNIPDF